MAKIRRFPSLAIISGFKKTLDFYEYMGQPCVRLWPKSPGHKRAPAVQAQWQAFSYIASQWPDLSPEIRAAYNRMAEGTGLNGKDFFTRGYLSGLYRYPTGSP